MIPIATQINDSAVSAPFMFPFLQLCRGDLRWNERRKEIRDQQRNYRAAESQQYPRNKTTPRPRVAKHIFFLST
jgi:hypothetical protein